jgi:hypothetical protein
MGEVMTPDPEVIPVKSTAACALYETSVGGFRRIPAVDEEDHPAPISDPDGTSIELVQQPGD